MWELFPARPMFGVNVQETKKMYNHCVSLGHGEGSVDGKNEAFLRQIQDTEVQRMV